MCSRPRLVSFVLALVLVLVLAVIAACSEEKVVAATQVVVSVHSNLEVGRQLSRVDVEVRAAASGKSVAPPRSFMLREGKPRAGEVTLPFSFTVTKADAERFRLDVIGYGPLGPNGDLRAVIERKTIARFRAQETLLLQVFLDAACFDNLCTGARTCYPERADDVAAGECGALPEPALPEIEPGDERDVWSGEPIPSAGKDGGDDGGAAGGDGSTAGGSGGAAGMDPDAGRPDAGEDSGMAEDAGMTGGSGGMVGSAGAGGSAGMSGSGGIGGGEPGCVPTGQQMFTRLSGAHVATPQDPSIYNSRPPSSGMHCDAWGRWEEFTPTKPLAACNFLHNLEHGAVVLLYNCPEGCPEVVEVLRGVVNDVALIDPNCAGQGIKRLLITPYAEMEAKLAAVAWGYTWTSECVDGQTHDQLLAFIRARWGTTPADTAPEPSICEHGSVER